MARSRWCQRRFDRLPPISRTLRRRGLHERPRQAPAREREPWQDVVLAYMLAAARAERRGQAELAAELHDCARALIDRAEA